MKPLFETVLDKVPVRNDDPDGPLQLQIISLDYSSYVGKIGVGRISRGRARPLQDVVVVRSRGQPDQGPHQSGAEVPGPRARDRAEAEAGDIVLINGIEELGIGCTVCAPEARTPCRC